MNLPHIYGTGSMYRVDKMLEDGDSRDGKRNAFTGEAFKR